MKITPLQDRVLLKGIEKDSSNTSGIYLPESSNKERPYLYEVIAVGSGKNGVEMQVSLGDTVLCGQYAGDEIKLDGVEYKIVASEYILAIVS